MKFPLQSPPIYRKTKFVSSGKTNHYFLPASCSANEEQACQAAQNEVNRACVQDKYPASSGCVEKARRASEVCSCRN